MIRFIKGNRGSITLEATVVFPVFLVFMLILINFIKVTMVYISMDHAVSETSKQIATQVYPLKYLKNGGDYLNSLVLNLPGSQGAAKKDTQGLAGSILGQLAKNKDSLSTKAINEVVKVAVAKRIKDYYPLGNIDEKDFAITQIKMYYPNDAMNTNVQLKNINLSPEDIAIVVKYKVKLSVPFFSIGDFNFTSTAVERAWVDH